MGSVTLGPQKIRLIFMCKTFGEKCTDHFFWYVSFCQLTRLRGLYESSSSRKWYFLWKKWGTPILFECSKNHVLWWHPRHSFGHSWMINLKIHFKTYCMNLTQKILIPTAFHYNRAKTGLRSRFYLNCSHMVKHVFWVIINIYHSMLGPDLVGLTVAVWYIVGQQCLGALTIEDILNRIIIRTLNVTFSIICALLYQTSLNILFTFILCIFAHFVYCLVDAVDLWTLVCDPLKTSPVTPCKHPHTQWWRDLFRCNISKIYYKEL